jgi:Mce-associated membrane protein
VTTEETTVNESSRSWVQELRAQWAAIALALLLIAALVVTAWLFFYQYRRDREVDDAAAKSAIKAASDGTVALLSYTPETLDKDFAAAKSKLTGDFLSYYTQFTEQIVTPAAKQKKVKTTASVVRSGVSELRPDSAVVLVFINQTTESSGLPEPSATVSSVRVSLKKVDGAWLISSFDPV